MIRQSTGGGQVMFLHSAQVCTTAGISLVPLGVTDAAELNSVAVSPLSHRMLLHIVFSSLLTVSPIIPSGGSEHNVIEPRSCTSWHSMQHTGHFAAVMQVGVIYGSPETTSGGMALKYFASVRIDVRKKEQITGADGTPIGIKVRAKMVKNKCAPPYR